MARSKIKIKDLGKPFGWLRDHVEDRYEDAQDAVRDTGYGRFVSEEAFDKMLTEGADPDDYYGDLVEKRPSRWDYKSWAGAAHNPNLMNIIGAQFGPQSHTRNAKHLLRSAFPFMGLGGRVKGGGYAQGPLEHIIHSLLINQSNRGWMDDDFEAKDYELTHRQINQIAADEGQAVNPFIEMADRTGSGLQQEMVHNPWSDTSRGYYGEGGGGAGTRGDVIAQLNESAGGQHYWANPERAGTKGWWKYTPPPAEGAQEAPIDADQA